MRSTVMVSGVATLRARGLFDRYVEHLSPEARQAILEAIAGTWLPVQFVLEHFGAIDALGLTNEEAFDIGASSGKRFGTTLWGTLVRLAKTAGADPWLPLRSYERIFPRAVDGGGFVVREHGPKEATIEFLSLPFSKLRYFRGAACGAHATLIGFFADTVYVREVPNTAHPNGFKMSLSWV
jgi:hypothetical protein